MTWTLAVRVFPRFCRSFSVASFPLFFFSHFFLIFSSYFSYPPPPSPFFSSSGSAWNTTGAQLMKPSETSRPPPRKDESPPACVFFFYWIDGFGELGRGVFYCVGASGRSIFVGAPTDRSMVWQGGWLIFSTSTDQKRTGFYQPRSEDRNQYQR